MIPGQESATEALATGTTESLSGNSHSGEAFCADVDVLIIGGGIQGLCILHELKARGVESAFLVTRDDLGAGETLHSHGYLMRGYMVPKEAPVQDVIALNEAFEWWAKFCEDRGIRYADNHLTYIGVPDDSRLHHWDEVGLSYEAITGLAKCFAGGHYEDSGKLYEIEDRLIFPPTIIEKFSEEAAGQIGKGEVTGLTLDEASNQIDAVQVNFNGRMATLKAKVVIAAAGKDNQQLLRGVIAKDGSQPFAESFSDFHRVRNVPMILAKGKGLPNVSGMFLDAKLSVFAHPVDRDELMWVVTPLGDHRTTRSDVDGRAEPEVESRLVRDALMRLTQIFPGVGEMLDENVLLSVYFGAKIDHPEEATRWFIANAGISNFRCVWPVLWSLARPAALSVIDQLEKCSEWRSLVKAKRSLDARVKTLASRVDVGVEKRLDKGQQWLSWSEFRERFQI
jgi:glycine/D-amino acid oxidase-like deaminating enzyme